MYQLHNYRVRRMAKTLMHLTLTAPLIKIPLIPNLMSLMKGVPCHPKLPTKSPLNQPRRTQVLDLRNAKAKAQLA